MDTRAPYRILMLAGLALALPAQRLLAQLPDSLPQGVTPGMIAQGKKLFGGEGLCMACHGPNGKGLVGPNLTDPTWLHGRGSYEEIVSRILEGVPAAISRSGVIMPPKGGSSLKEEQVKAVAAYVWSLSRPSRAKPGATLR